MCNGVKNSLVQEEENRIRRNEEKLIHQMGLYEEYFEPIKEMVTDLSES